MPVALSPIFNGFQSFLPSGLPNNGGFIYTYGAGTTTPVATYTTNTGGVANANPIPLSAFGFPPNEIWLTVGTAYKLVVTDSTLTPIAGASFDNIQGVANSGSLATSGLTGVAASGVNSDITALNGVISAYMASVVAATNAAAARVAIGAASIGAANVVINGSIAVDQEHAGAAITLIAGAALKSCVDQWYGYCTGANVTGQQVAAGSSGQAKYRYIFTGAASVTGVGFGTRLEAVSTYAMNSLTCSFGVDLSISSSITSVGWAAYYANTADTFGTLASPTRTLIASGTFTVSSTIARYTAQIAVPTAATTGIEIVLTVGALTAGITWNIGQIQYEAGTVSTSFENRGIGVETFLCQRFWEPLGVNDSNGNNVVRLMYNSSNEPKSFCNSYPFKATKRVFPTVTTYGLAGVAGQVEKVPAGAGGADISIVSITPLTVDSFSVYLGPTTTAGFINIYSPSNVNARLY